MRRHRLLGLLLAGLLGLSACGEVPSGVVATVNGVEISTDTLERQVRARAVSQLDLPRDQPLGAAQSDQLRELQRQVVSELVNVEIALQIAEARGIEVSEEDVQDRFEQTLALFESEGEAPAEEAFRQRLDELGFTVAEARERMRADVIVQERLNASFTEGVDVDPEEVRELYEQRREQQYERVDLDEIVVGGEAEAAAVRNLLEEGADFAELARERSTDQFTAQIGGDRGAVPRAQLPPPVAEAAFAADPGDLVGPIETGQGFHVLRVNGFDTVPFSAVRDSLRQELAGQRGASDREAFFTEFLADLEVEIDPRYGIFDAGSGQVLDYDPLTKGPAAPPQSQPLAPDR